MAKGFIDHATRAKVPVSANDIARFFIRNLAQDPALKVS